MSIGYVGDHEWKTARPSAIQGVSRRLSELGAAIVFPRFLHSHPHRTSLRRLPHIHSTPPADSGGVDAADASNISLNISLFIKSEKLINYKEAICTLETLCLTAHLE